MAFTRKKMIGITSEEGVTGYGDRPTKSSHLDEFQPNNYCSATLYAIWSGEVYGRYNSH